MVDIEKIKEKIKIGFTQHKSLNQKIFDGDQMRPEVRKQLLKIADDFIDSLGIDDIDFEDITMTGSLSNYNWNPYSDVDLHVIFDFKEIDDNQELVSEFFMSKKSLWNQEHDIKIYDYDVEIYGQSIDEEHHSTGVYSVLNDEWVIKPKPEKYKLETKKLIKKSKYFMKLIDDVIDGSQSEEFKIEKINRIKEKIKKYRQSGLENGGEFSEENMVFKILRRLKYLDKLSDIKHELIDKNLSLPE